MYGFSEDKQKLAAWRMAQEVRGKECDKKRQKKKNKTAHPYIILFKISLLMIVYNQSWSASHWPWVQRKFPVSPM